MASFNSYASLPEGIFCIFSGGPGRMTTQAIGTMVMELQHLRARRTRLWTWDLGPGGGEKWMGYLGRYGL